MSSSNRKNQINKAFMRNFVSPENDQRRQIYVSDPLVLTRIKKDIEVGLNAEVNYHIQELNLRLVDRLIPYVTLTVHKDPSDNSRIVIVDPDYDADEPRNIMELAHLIEFFITPGFKTLTFSHYGNEAKLIIDRKYRFSACSDIFLDTAMFHSYSFLSDLSQNEKEHFRFNKKTFAQNHNLSNYYEVIEDDIERLENFSLAFSARVTETEFDFDKYIALWNDFINEYYPDNKNAVPDLMRQIKGHVDCGQLPKSIREATEFQHCEAGAYLLLRINRTHCSIDLIDTIKSRFGIQKIEIGPTKIIPISKYKEIERLLKALDVSAYKVVKQ